MNTSGTIHAIKADAAKFWNPLQIVEKLQMPAFDMVALLKFQQKQLSDIAAINCAFLKNMRAFAASHAELMHLGIKNTVNITGPMMPFTASDHQNFSAQESVEATREGQVMKVGQ